MSTHPKFARCFFQVAVVSLLLLSVGSVGAQQNSAENSNHPAPNTTSDAPQATTKPATLSDDSDVQLGHAVHADDPEVPKDLRDKPVGSVLSATLKSDGTFSDIMSFGQSEFDNIAIAAVRQWRYTPATLNGSPVDVGVFIIIGAVKGKVATTVEPDLPIPRKPKTPVEDQLARGELFRVVANQVTTPKGIYTPDPEYSTPARAAKYQGTTLLGAIVGSDGKMADVWVIRKLGLGLDQKAIATVRQWRFEPATKAGQPVPILINIEVKFRLY